MKRLYILILALLHFTILVAQQEARINRLEDSLRFLKDDTLRVNTCRLIGTLYYGIQPDSALYFTKKGLDLAEKIKWTKGIAQCSLNLGVYWRYISRYDSAVYYSTKALAAAELAGDKNRIALVYINRGSDYTEIHEYGKAIADLSAAMRIGEETGNKDRQARVSQSMCELYMYQDNNEAAIPWAEKSLLLFTELGNVMQQGIAKMSLGGLYSIKKNFTQAETFLKDAIEKLNKTNRPDMIVECAISLADVYMKTQKPGDAIAVLQTGLNNAHTLQLVDRESAIYSSLGDAWLLNKDYHKAMACYQNGYQIIKGKTEFQKNQYLNLEGIAKASAMLGNYKDAWDYSLLAGDLKDSVTTKQQDEKQLKLQTQFETVRKEREIELLKKDQALGKSELQKEQTIKAGAFILSGLLVLIGFLVINRFRTIQRTKRLIEIEKIRNSIARDLHDDIGSTLSSININTKIALNHAGAETLVKTQLEKIKKNSASIMENMSDIVWAIDPTHDSVQNLAGKMKEFLAEILEPLGIQYVLDETASLKNVTLDVNKRKEIYLVFKEAVNNAAKYSDCKNIYITISADKKQIVLAITDDGSGFDKALVKAGNGLNNMRQRASMMKGTVHIESAAGRGTKLVMNIPSG